jgi:L-alanine-DL-glutamate epimerase-like enolase superfamily enzyme
MKITRVECVQLRLPVVTLASEGTQDDLVVLVHTDAGITGVGEVLPSSRR